MKKWVTLGIIVGSIVGGFVPELWGASAFGLWAVITSTIGALIGIWAGVKLGQYFDI
jgi:uncharacterized membrane protein YeaQ/YmgE (transglycosylase-associated protein family)